MMLKYHTSRLEITESSDLTCISSLSHIPPVPRSTFLLCERCVRTTGCIPFCISYPCVLVSCDSKPRTTHTAAPRCDGIPPPSFLHRFLRFPETPPPRNEWLHLVSCGQRAQPTSVSVMRLEPNSLGSARVTHRFSRDDPFVVSIVEPSLAV